MRRYALNRLIQWKNQPSRKPMLIRGARQTGKTWLMKRLGEVCFQKTAYISFFENKNLQRVFDEDFNLKRILANLSVVSGTEITPENTLIIFDEIQEVPRAIESLKFFCEKAPEYPIVAAGSLLGVALHEGISFPVGKVDLLELYPMNFREFLEAMGEQQLADVLVREEPDLINDFHEDYMHWLRNYCYVGGMPEIVDFFRVHTDYSRVREMQLAILQQYKSDFGKHIEPRQIPRLNMVWDSLPMQLAKDNKKFFFGNVKKGARATDFETAIQWMEDSGLIYKVHKVNEPHVPLSAYKDPHAYKLFMLDVGLLGAMSGVDSESVINGNELFVEFKGALAEQLVCQQIISDTSFTPYYYATSSAHFEQDFLIQMKRQVIPIEVKAGGNLQSRSLKAYCDKYNPLYSIRFSALGYKDQDWIRNYPLYAVSRIEDKDGDDYERPTDIMKAEAEDN